MTVPVFISYHGSDLEIARELSKSLQKLSDQFTVFLDKDTIPPGDKFESRIAEAITQAEWFLIICTGFPRRDGDMMWSFFEAGQFRATLKESLVPEANKRIVCVFDNEPPSILSMFQGVRVCGQQRSGSKIDLSTLPPQTNGQLDDSAIYDLLERMLKNEPGVPLRNTSDLTTKEMLREESFKLIKLFESARPSDLRFEKSLQPRLSFELARGQKLISETVIKGYEQSLRTLFGIETDDTTWGKILETCDPSHKGKQTWLSDIEEAAVDIMADRTPENHGNKCILKDKVIYRVIVARYEVYKDERRTIYIVFLPVSTQPFDLTKSSSTLLSSMILSIRFREQIIPIAAALKEAKGQPERLEGLLREFYRLLVAVEMEARQFGLVLDSDIPADEAPLTIVVKNQKRRTFIQTSIDNWSADRRRIEDMFVVKTLDLHAVEQAQQCAQEIVAMLKKVNDVNEQFIEYLAEELLEQIHERDRRSSKRKVARQGQVKGSPSRKARRESRVTP